MILQSFFLLQIVTQGSHRMTPTVDPVKLSMLQSLTDFASANPAIKDALTGKAVEGSVTAYRRSIYVQARASAGEPAFHVVYDHPDCHLALPPSRVSRFDFMAGRLSRVQMFMPNDMLDLADAIDLGRTIGKTFASGGGMQLRGAEKGISEDSIKAQVGEQSAIVAKWRICGPGEASALITVRYYGSEFTGTTVPMGVGENPFHTTSKHFLVELNIMLGEAQRTALSRIESDRVEKIRGTLDDTIPLKEWLEHPEWSRRAD